MKGIKAPIIACIMHINITAYSVHIQAECYSQKGNLGCETFSSILIAYDELL
jgi:hypothetical protein